MKENYQPKREDSSQDGQVLYETSDQSQEKGKGELEFSENRMEMALAEVDTNIIKQIPTNQIPRSSPKLVAPAAVKSFYRGKLIEKNKSLKGNFVKVNNNLR